MAEVQTSTQSGELSQRFIEFVMMHAQNAAPVSRADSKSKNRRRRSEPGAGEDVHRSAGHDSGKTRGNLTNEETTVLRNALSNLQMAYVEVAAQEAPRGSPEAGSRSKAAAPPKPAEQTSPS